MISRNHLQKLCAGLHVFPLHQNHILLTFLLSLFGAVSQNYPRYCLLGYSPPFLLNKTLFTTFWLCFFQVYTVLSISSSGPRITPSPISTKINIITAFGPQCPSSKICVLCIGTSPAPQGTGWRGGGGERKMVERDRGGGYFTCSSWISPLSVPLGYHHLPIERLSSWGFPDSSVGKESACNAGDLGSIPGLGRSPGEGKDYPIPYSGLEKSMTCIVHGVAKSRTGLSNFHFT